MKIEKLVEELRHAYANAPRGEVSTVVHLFGIRFASELDGAPINEIAARAGLTENWGTEIRKGMRLAKYVTLNGANG